MAHLSTRPETVKRFAELKERQRMNYKRCCAYPPQHSLMPQDPLVEEVSRISKHFCQNTARIKFLTVACFIITYTVHPGEANWLCSFKNFLPYSKLPSNREFCMQSTILFPSKLSSYNGCSLNQLSVNQEILYTVNIQGHNMAHIAKRSCPFGLPQYTSCVRHF